MFSKALYMTKKRVTVTVEINAELNDKIALIKQHSGVAFPKKIFPTVVDFINDEYEKVPERLKNKANRKYAAI